MAQQAGTHREIPEPTKRIVRQRCGFGCVICGVPLYEYHHMVEWAQAKTHNAADITLLCDAHHRQATNGLLTSEQVRNFDAKPINPSRGVSTPFGLNLALDKTRIVHAVIGGNRFSTSQQGHTAFVSIDEMDLVSVRIDDVGGLFLHLNIFDENNNSSLRVDGNDLVYASDAWDITFEGTTLTLREAHRELLLQITFLPPRTISIDRASLLFNGIEVIVTPAIVYCAGRVLAGSLLHNCQAGIVLGRDDRGFAAAVRWSNLPRYSAEQRRKHKNDAFNEQAKLGAIVNPHSASGTERYVSTVQGCEDFHIINESRETDVSESKS